VAKAKASAVPQSMPVPVSILTLLASKIFLTSLWKFLSAGRVVMVNPVSYMLYFSTPEDFA
jgi:hypothetical protein